MAEKLLLLCKTSAEDDSCLGTVVLETVGMGRTGGALKTLLCRL